MNKLFSSLLIILIIIGNHIINLDEVNMITLYHDGHIRINLDYRNDLDLRNDQAREFIRLTHLAEQQQQILVLREGDDRLGRNSK